MKNFHQIIALAGVLILTTMTSTAQVSLDQLIAAGLENAPIKSIKLITADEDALTQKNIQAMYLPQITLGGQATYQSEVTEINIPIPGVDIDPLSLDQYKLSAEVNQMIYDGGLTKQKGKVQQTASNLAQMQVDLELERLRKQIIELYFAILAIDRKDDILSLKEDNLLANLEVVKEAHEQGAVLASEVLVIEAAHLRLQQQQQSLQRDKSSLIQTLSIITKTPNSDLESLVEPVARALSYTVQPDNYSDRIFDLQASAVEQQYDLQLAAHRPKLNLFLQGGYGKPGLNFLKNQFDAFYIMGLRANWNLGSLYTKANDREITMLKKEKINARRAAYLDQTHVQIAQHEAAIEATRENIKRDELLVDLYRDIRQTAEIQIRNGAITSTELLEKINDEHEASIHKALHELDLIKSSYILQHVTGNYLVK